MENYVKAKTPWENSLGDVPLTVPFYNGSIFGAINNTAKKYPQYKALSFINKTINYSQLIINVKICASILKNLGISKKDRVVISLPNCPQAVYFIYACSLLGAIACVIHPLSAERQLSFYVKDTNAKVVITLNSFYPKFHIVEKENPNIKMIVTYIEDELAFPLNHFYKFSKEAKKYKNIKFSRDVIFYKGIFHTTKILNFDSEENGSDECAILYSGGTSGSPKGIVHINDCFNSAGEHIIASNKMFVPGDRMLAVLPLFHGFGLAVGIHSMLTHGGHSILIPRFSAEGYVKYIQKFRCNFIAGVPSLFEALLRLKNIETEDFSSLKGIYSGGDSLSIDLKKRLDIFLKNHKCKVTVREGYGTTETLTVCCLTPANKYKPGSIGIPVPNTYFKIVKPGTDIELPFNEEGEIVIAGPSVMKEYLNNPKETNETLHRHNDGLLWAYTGDLGYMDLDGFVYFKGRIKRLIVSSGYNIHPSYVENVLDSFELVEQSCVIGIKDEVKGARVKAYIMLKPGFNKNDESKNKIFEFCKKNIDRYALPAQIEFVDEFPKTDTGKIDYRFLEQQN